MITVIRSTQRPISFLKVSNEGLSLTTNIEQCSVFNSGGYVDSSYLEPARKQFKKMSLVISEIPLWLIDDLNKQLIEQLYENYLEHTE